MPAISVVMPVYNGEKYLSLAIESILTQTFEDFEFIIINDGSRDKTKNIILGFNDSRIVYIENQSNLGLSKSLNIGVRASRGKYIARMDADDISIKDRLKGQLEFMETHKDVDVLGSSVMAIDENGFKKRLFRRALSHLEIKWESLFSVPLYHTTLFAKAEIMKSNPYDESIPNSEDYELFSRLIFSADKTLANLRHPLVFYRVFPNSFTQTLNKEKRSQSALNTISNLKHYITLSSKEEELIIDLKREQPISNSDLLSVIKVYVRASHSFARKEGLKFISAYMHKKLLEFFFFLLKYKFKKLYQRVSFV